MLVLKYKNNQNCTYEVLELRRRCAALPGKTRKHENHIFHSTGLCYTQCTCALSFWKKKLSSVMCLVAS